jgi:hypothetical protein
MRLLTTGRMAAIVALTTMCMNCGGGSSSSVKSDPAAATLHGRLVIAVVGGILAYSRNPERPLLRSETSAGVNGDLFKISCTVQNKRGAAVAISRFSPVLKWLPVIPLLLREGCHRHAGSVALAECYYVQFVRLPRDQVQGLLPLRRCLAPSFRRPSRQVLPRFQPAVLAAITLVGLRLFAT